MPACIRVLALLLLFAHPAHASRQKMNHSKKSSSRESSAGPGLWAGDTPRGTLNATRPVDRRRPLRVAEAHGNGSPPRHRSNRARFAGDPARRVRPRSKPDEEDRSAARPQRSVPALMKARKNPDDKKLEERCSPPDPLRALGSSRRRSYLRGTKKALEDVAPVVRGGPAAKPHFRKARAARARRCVGRQSGNAWRSGKVPAQLRRRSRSSSSVPRCAARSRSSRANRSPTSSASARRSILTEVLANRDVRDPERAQAWARADLQRARGAAAAAEPRLYPASLAVHRDRTVATRAHSRRHPRADRTRLWVDTMRSARLGAERRPRSRSCRSRSSRAPTATSTRLRAAKGYAIEPPR